MTKETLEKIGLNKIKNSCHKESSEPQENATAAHRNVGQTQVAAAAGDLTWWAS